MKAKTVFLVILTAFFGTEAVFPDTEVLDQENHNALSSDGVQSPAWEPPCQQVTYDERQGVRIEQNPTCPSPLASLGDTGVFLLETQLTNSEIRKIDFPAGQRQPDYLVETFQNNEAQARQTKSPGFILNQQTCFPDMEQNAVVMEKVLHTSIPDTEPEEVRGHGSFFLNVLNSYFMAPGVIAIEAAIHLQKAWTKGHNYYWETFCPHRSSRPRELFFLAVYAIGALLNIIEYQLPQMTGSVEGCSYQIETFASHVLVHTLMAFGSVLTWQKDCACINPYVNPHVAMMAKHIAQLAVMTALGLSSYVGF